MTPSSRSPLSSFWHIELFGGLRARQVGGQGERLLTRFRTQSTGALLSYLAFYKGRSHTREMLIELLWPGVPHESGRHNLSNALSSLRNQLEPPGVLAGTVLAADRLSVELNPAAITSDVEAFEQALRQAGLPRTAAVQRAQCLTRAVELYKGPLLSGSFEAWVLSEQERLAQRFQDSLRHLVRLHERQGDIATALTFAYRAASLQNVPDEEASRDLIRLLLAQNDPGAALCHYRQLEERLNEEWEEAPASATRMLILQIEEVQRRTNILVQESPQSSQSPRSLPAVPPQAADTSAKVRRLPEGTVTFLMLEARIGPALSTAAVSNATDRTEAPAAENEVADLLGERVRAVLDRHRGHGASRTDEPEIWLAAFALASDALACALALHEALMPLTLFPETAGISARIALHTGEAVLDATGQYPGQMIRTVTQILLAAHGGQILCSAATAELVRRDGAPNDSGLTLADLGLFRLWTGGEAERLFQVQGPKMSPASFPPPSAERADSGTVTVPLQFTRFFGREKEIDRLKEMVRTPDVRLVTLTGIGGTGKTRLAIETAGQLEDRFAGAVWFVLLADLTDPTLIAGAIADTLHLPRSGNAEMLGQIAARLSTRPSLLILDNFEHLLGKAGTDKESGVELVQGLLERVRALTILVTSRQILSLPAEHEVAVLPLRVPEGNANFRPEDLSLFESVRLFVDRAQRVKPDFQVTANNVSSVATLCVRLEGIPLAIELAATRIAVLTPAQMLSLLDNRFALLVSRKRGITARHRTFQATLDWSYDLLPPALQRFFAGLSVFRGGWTVEAAEAVCEEPLALDYLAELCECSLVVTEEATGSTGSNGNDGSSTSTTIRFRMLETLREYATDRAQELEVIALQRRRHRAFYLGAAESYREHIGGPGERIALDWMESEHDNLRAVLERCYQETQDEMNGANSSDGAAEWLVRLAMAIEWLWTVRGYGEEGRQWLTRAQEVFPPGLDPRRGARVLYTLATFIPDGRDTADERIALFTEARQIHRNNADIRGEAGALIALGNLLRLLGDYRAACVPLQECLDLHDRPGFPAPAVTSALLYLGRIYSQWGEDAEAGRLLHEALERCEQPGSSDNVTAGGVRTSLGVLAWNHGELQRAEACFSRAREIYQEIGYHGAESQCLSSLGSIASQRGDHSAARRLHAEAWTLLRPGSSPRSEALALGYRAISALRAGDYGDAGDADHASIRVDLLQAFELFKQVWNRPEMAHTLEWGADYLCLAQRRHADAVTLWAAAASIRADLGAPVPLVERAWRDAQVAGARSIVGEDAFESLWLDGLFVSLDDTIALLSLPAHIPSPLSADSL